MDRVVEDDRIAGHNAGYIGAAFGDDASAFVPENRRQLYGEFAFHRGEIGVAKAGSGHRHQHFALCGSANFDGVDYQSLAWRSCDGRPGAHPSTHVVLLIWLAEILTQDKPHAKRYSS
jgi:hypothetical protein